MARPIRFDLTRRAVLGAGAALFAGPGVAQAAPLSVFAAASLKPALDEIATDWDGPMALSYGGSGTVARQVASGAPADLVVLAATDWMDWLGGQGALAGSVQAVAGNRLVLAGPPGAAALTLTGADIAARLGPAGRFAMGDPISVPAGRYGQQALETLGLWSDLRRRAILAENVRAALAYVARGDVDLGLVYRSDVRGTGAVEVAAVPTNTHQPIIYPAAIVRGASPQAGAFLAHLRAATPVFVRHGFDPVPAA